MASIRLAVTYRQMCEQSDAELRKLLYQHSLNAHVKLDRIDVGNDSFTDDVKLHDIEIIAENDLKIENVSPEETVVAYNFDVISSNSYGENIWKSEDSENGQRLSDYTDCEQITHQKCVKKRKLSAAQMNQANRPK